MEKVWLYAAIGGFVPAFFWLYFWLKEDTYQPEPKKLIAKTFVFGILSAFLALSIQALISNLSYLNTTVISGIIIFAFIEELFKYGAVFVIALRAKDFDERIDPIIYMITAALGFVAIENMFYIIDYIDNLEYLRTLLNGSQRFIGATLVHTIASSLVGISIAIVFFKKKNIRRFTALIGIFFATVFHSMFNFLVISNNETYEKIAFYSSWIFIIVILIFFEYFNRDKKIRSDITY